MKIINLFSNKKFGIHNRIYFDNASAVPVSPIARKSFLEMLDMYYANPSSIHFEGEKAKDVLFESRKKIAKSLHTKSENIRFVSSTTEANNIFIKGVILNAKITPSLPLSKGGNSSVHVIYSSSDHSSIVDVVESCKIIGAEISNVVPNKIGILPIENILNQITENTKLICFSYVSSELGTVQPVRKIVQAVKEHWEKNFNISKNSDNECPKIFIDASQAAKYESIDVSNLLVDGMTFGASKIGGVQGAALLYIKKGTKIISIISGGGQEEGIRSGTENLPAIVAFANTLEKVCEPLHQKENREKVFGLRNYAIVKLQEVFPSPGEGVEIFGDTKYKFNKFYEYATPHILLISLVDMLGEETLLRLDSKGISVSTASACSLLENSGSSFLKSIGEPVKAKETIRLSFSEKNTTEEIDYFVEVLKNIKEKFIK